ncbi:MAG: DUF885 domain-containing protein [Chthoniobacterales bacterium]
MRKSSPSEQEVRSFYRITNKFLAETYARYPQWASRLGLTKFHGRLGNNSAATHQAQISLIERTLLQVEGLAEDAFYGDDWLNRRAFIAWLRTDLVREKILRRRERNPQIHCEEATEAIFHLLVRYSGNLRKMVPQIESRLKEVPKFLAEGLRQLRNPVPLWAKLARSTVKGSMEFFSEIEPEIVRLSSNPKRTKKLFADVQKALGNYRKGIAKKPLGNARDYQTGPELFELLTRERLGISLSITEIESIGRRQITKIKQELKAEAKRFGSASVDNILKSAREQWKISGDLRAIYEKKTFGIRDNLEHLKLVSLPAQENLKVLDVPAFLRSQFPTAAYSQPGAFDRKQEGIFWVNDLGKGKPAAEALRERQQHFGLELTCAHEAYPGHHLQFVIQNNHPQKLRRLFEHSVFYEGWTLWCEKLSVEKGLIRHPQAKLQQLHDSLWRAYRILIDCGLHSGKMSIQQAMDVLVKGLGFTKSRARAEINWYSSAPTVPMSYLLGRLEVERLFRWFTKNRSRDLRAFNDWLLSYGAVPQNWIWESLRRQPE